LFFREITAATEPIKAMIKTIINTNNRDLNEELSAGVEVGPEAWLVISLAKE
jgi:hypothetical protein